MPDKICNMGDKMTLKANGKDKKCHWCGEPAYVEDDGFPLCQRCEMVEPWRQDV